MAIKKSALGRGLDALLADVKFVTPTTSAQQVAMPNNTVKKELRQLPVEFLQRGVYQPRRDMPTEQLEELAESIRVQGIIQPILVRPIADNRYEIIAGERRWRAAQLAGLETVPVLVRELSENDAMAIALIENLQREDLNPMDTALGLHRLLTECKLTHQDVAKAVGKSRSTVTNLLRLLDLTSEVKILLEQGQIEMGHARALLSLAPQQQIKLAHMVSNQQLSVRQTEALVMNAQQHKKRVTTKNLSLDPNIQYLQNNISEHLGAIVEIKHRADGKGQLVIKYHSNDELSGILEKIFNELSVS